MHTIETCFTSSGVPALGLTPTIRIWALNQGSPQTDVLVVGGGSPLAFMSETGDGLYKYNFAAYDPFTDYAFRADGGAGLADVDRYAFGATECADPEEIWAVTLSDATSVAGSIGSTVVANQATMTSILETLLKYDKNRTRVDAAARTLTIYDDDCTTPLRVFDLKGPGGSPSVTEVCERVPVGGSPPCP